jgi:hypothetical protein
MGLSCEFFADEEDLRLLVSDFSLLGSLKYVEIDSTKNATCAVISEPTLILGKAMVSASRPSRRHSYLAMPAEDSVISRRIELSDGSGWVEVVDQNANWNSVAIALGGDGGDKTLVMSDINTVSDTQLARDLHRRFKDLVAARGELFGAKGRRLYLLPGTIEKGRMGWRLARNKSWAKATDFALSDDERPQA